MARSAVEDKGGRDGPRVMTKRYRRTALAMLACLAAPLLAHAQAYQTAAPYAFLMDADTHTVLFAKQADALMDPASTTKLMTAEVVFEEIAQHRLKLTDTFTISDRAWREGGARSGGSTMFANLHSQVAVSDLLQGLLVQSGNDAAIALAEGISGSEEAFVTLMNQRARALGMTKSHFDNAWGDPQPDHKVTAREMALLTDHIIQTFPSLYAYCAEKQFTWNKITQRNRNPLLFMNIGADGVKTGFTKASGFGLIGSAVQNGERLIVVVNGLKTAIARGDEARKLLEWGFRSFESRQLFKAGSMIGSAQIYGGATSSVNLESPKPIRLLVPRGTDDPITGEIRYQGPLMAPVNKGASVASLAVLRDGKVLATFPLETADSVKMGSLPQRALDAAQEYATDLIRKYIFRL